MAEYHKAQKCNVLEKRDNFRSTCYFTFFNCSIYWGGIGGQRMKKELSHHATLKPPENYLAMENIPITKDMHSHNLPYAAIICHTSNFSIVCHINDHPWPYH